MNGILCINKPEGFTSFDVVAKMRGISGERKIGHAGTLDPIATGVLPLLFGRATKACDILPDETKRYKASFRLGVETDTQDRTGKVLAESTSVVPCEKLIHLLPSFVGQIKQVPPMYSAVRINGQHLYDLARRGCEVVRKPREVQILELSLLEYNVQTREGLLDVKCSKGTYVRTLIHDIGRTLKVGGILTSLVRTESSGFGLTQCITLEEAQQLAKKNKLEERVIPVSSVYQNSPAVFLNSVQKRMFLNGVRLDLNRINYQKGGKLHAVYGPEKEFLGVAFLDFEKKELQVVSFF